jgi:hypothetical protein
MNNISNALIALAVLMAVIAGIVSVFQINSWYLAGTQWMMIAIIFGIFALYAEMKKKV